MGENNHHQKSIVLITIITIVAKVIGFLRETVLAHYYGTSIVVDAFVMATTIPGILFGGITALAVCFIPIYKKIQVERGKEDADHFTNKCVTYISILCVFAILLVELFSDPIVTIIAPGYKGANKDLLTYYLRFAILQIIFLNLSAVLSAYLNCQKIFVETSLTTLLLSSIQIIGIILSEEKDSIIIIYSFIISYIAQFIALVCICLKNRYRYKLEYKFDTDIKLLIHMVIPVFLSDMAGQINAYIDKMFSSFLGEGVLSGLTYSHLIISLVENILTTGILMVLFEQISEWVARSERDKINTQTSRIIVILFMLYLPITMGLIVFHDEIIRIVYYRGSFDETSLKFTAMPLAMYSLGLIPTSFNLILTKILYAEKNSKTPLIASITMFVVNGIANLALIHSMGGSGLALASAISALSCLPIYLRKLKKIGYNIFKPQMMKSLPRIIISSAIMLVFLLLCKFFHLTTSNLWVIVLILGAAALYGLMLILLRVPEVNVLLSMVRLKNRKEAR